MFSSLCQFVDLVVFHFGFEDRTLVLIASVPGHCLPFTVCLVLPPCLVDVVATW